MPARRKIMTNQGKARQLLTSTIIVGLCCGFAAAEASLPDYFDYRREVYTDRNSAVTTSTVPAVKNQGNYGTCWVFASLGSYETNWNLKLKANGISGTAPNFSERYLAWLTYAPPLDGTWSDPKYYYKPDNHYPKKSFAYNVYNMGGFAVPPFIDMMRWGNALDSTYPYDGYDVNMGGIQSIVASAGDVHDLYGWKLGNVKAGQTDKIKQLLTDCGAVDISIYVDWDKTMYRNNLTEYYKKDGYSGTNHAVVIVGWDDAYQFKLFKNEDGSTITGAWIVRNSWGTDATTGKTNLKDGYFYVPYQDTSIALSGAFNPEMDLQRYTRLDTNNDTAGRHVSEVPSVFSYANKLTAQVPQMLKAVNFNVEKDASSYKIEIRTRADTPTGGKLVYSQAGTFGQDGTPSYGGQRTVDLDKFVFLPAGGEYMVVITVKTPDGERQNLYYAKKDEACTQNIIMQPGLCFYYNSESGVWEDTYTSNLMIPVYARSKDSALANGGDFTVAYLNDDGVGGSLINLGQEDELYGYDLLHPDRKTLSNMTVDLTKGQTDSVYGGTIYGEGQVIKVGTGILALTGGNTYTGATSVKEGTLALTGSLTSPVTVSQGALFTGTGTVQDDVVNKGTLQPGLDPDSASLLGKDTSVGRLTIVGDLSGGGDMAIAVDSQKQTWSTIIVGGSADITGGKIVPVAGYYPVPGNTYAYLEANHINGNVQDNKVNSVMTLTGSVADDTASFTAESAGLTNVGGLNGVQDSMLSGLDKISARFFAADPSSASTHTLLPLYYADDAVIRKAGTELAAEERTRLLQPNPLSHLSVNAARSRLDTFAVEGKIQVPYKVKGLVKAQEASANLPVTLDEQNNLWLQIFRGYQAENCDSSLSNNTLGGMVGYDRSLDSSSRLGGFVSCGKTDYNGDNINGHSYDWRVGMYGSKVNGDWDYQALLSYGQNRYDLDHDLRFFGKNLNADFKAKVWDADLKARYTLPSTRSKVWQVRPYGQLSYTHTGQDAYTERGSEVLAQSLDGTNNNSWRAEAGVEFKRQLEKNGTFTGSLGYKRVLSGADPELNGSFLADKSAGFTLKSSSDKNYLTYSLAIRGSLGGKWTGEVGLMGEYAPHSHSEIVGVTAKYSF